MPVPIPDSYWIVEGRFLAGEYPGAADVATARPKLERFLDRGVNLFIDLTEQHELVPYGGFVETLGSERGISVRHERFPIRDVWIPSDDEMVAILARIRSGIDGGHVCYVHCWGGVGRTGTVVGCWLVQENGMTANAALERIAEMREGTPDGWKRSPETVEQRAFVRKWAERTSR